MASDTCGECNSDKLEMATLTSAAIQPDRASAWTKATSGAEIKVRVCMDCGRIDQLRADVARLKKMLPDG